MIAGLALVAMALPAHAASIAISNPADGHFAKASLPHFPEAVANAGLYNATVSGSVDLITPPSTTIAHPTVSGTIPYTEVSCAVGEASGTLSIGSVSYTLTYVRVGAAALVALTGGSDGSNGAAAVIFVPEGDPVTNAEACGTNTVPDDGPPAVVDFYGAGAVA
jgi:hypothetical protein